MTTELTWIDVPGGRVAAEAHGDGPPILLVHSAIVNRRSWDPIIPKLNDAGYRTITYDMRGFGESKAEDAAYEPHADVVAVLDHFGVGQAALGGNSLGGAFALDALIASPARFVAYTWVGAGIGGFDKGAPDPEEEQLFQAESDAEDAKDWDLAAEYDTRIWVDGWRDGHNLPATRVDPTVRAAIKAMDRELLEPGRVYGEFKRISPPAIDRLGEVSVPVLVAIGELDTSGTRAAAQVMAERVRGARLEWIPNAAHILSMEAPDRLATLMLELLAPLPRWS